MQAFKSLFMSPFIYYRQPCVATQPIMFCYSLLSAALRSNAADYVLLRFIYLFFFLFIFFLFTVRSHKLPDRFSQNFQELCILV